MSYSTLPPGASSSIKSYEISTPQETLDELKTLIRASKIAPPTFESLHADAKSGKYGVSYEWLQNAKEEWLKFDWKKTEGHLNSFPHFMASVPYKEFDYNVHFLGLFSKKKDAVPLVLLHGWPGSFLEFVPTVSLLKAKYDPETLPYHVVVPSLPGYAFSSGPPTDRDFATDELAPIIDALMRQLGFEDGYVAQGGDIGSMVTRSLGESFPSCKATHVNFFASAKPDGVDDPSTLPEHEQLGLARMAGFYEHGFAYGKAHDTRPATLGFVLQSSPIALLAWIGEKFISWTDETPPLQTILEDITLYWITDTIARCIYPYRSFRGERERNSKPFGFSSFAKEIMAAPESWVKVQTNLVFYRYHDKGGHFAALEKPEVFLQDVEDFVEQAWQK